MALSGAADARARLGSLVARPTVPPARASQHPSTGRESQQSGDACGPCVARRSRERVSGAACRHGSWSRPRRAAGRRPRRPASPQTRDAGHVGRSARRTVGLRHRQPRRPATVDECRHPVGHRPHDPQASDIGWALGSAAAARTRLWRPPTSTPVHSTRSPTNQRIGGCLQTDAQINGGNSGGPLLDSAGRVVGINCATFGRTGTGRGSGVNFALAIDMVARVTPKLILFGGPGGERTA